MTDQTSRRPSGRMTGGRALAEMVKLADLGPMFGMGGFQLLPYYEGIRDLKLDHHLINDERSGVFAADAYARITNKPAVCDGTLGPGATNLVTGLVESLNAGVPLLAITGDAHRAHSSKNMTQETRQVEILRPAVKELIRVETPARIPEAVRWALSVATSGRPGPVLLDVAEDVSHGEHDFAETDFAILPQTNHAPSRRTRAAASDVEAAAAILRQAKRPIILVGGGIHLSQAYDALLRLATALQIPVAHTMSGKGAIPCVHPLSAGLFGRYSRFANELIDSSDCLLVVGCKLGEVATRRFSLIPQQVAMIHLDIVAEEFGRTTTPTVSLWTDARLGLEDLSTALADDARKISAAHAEYVQELPVRLAAWRREASQRLHSAERPINVGRLVQSLNDALPEDAILVADGGFAAHWTALLFDTKVAGRHYVANRGFASIGYGLPGGLGAALAAPDRPVVAVTGDGGLNMVLGELETARRAKANNLTIVVINNAASGYVKALQHAMFGKNYQSSDLVEMDYAAIANAMGCEGIRVEDPDQIVAALRRGMENRSRPTVIDVIVTRDPSQMLPGIDSRTVQMKAGDRIA